MQLVADHIPTKISADIPVWDIDPYDAEILRNPASYYVELRKRGPFVHIPRYAILACGRFNETREVFSDWQRFVSSRGVGLTDFQVAPSWRKPSIVLEVEPPYHTRTRTVISRALSPRAVSVLKDAFAERANALVDELVERGEFDLVPDLAEAFPVSVFPAAVGLQEIDTRALVDFGAFGFNALGPDNALRRAALERGPQIMPWIMKHCKREALAPGGFGETIYAAADAGELTEDEAAMLVRSLLSAGVDTTVTGIGNAVWCLASNPGEFEKLKRDPKLARPAFEEALRYTSPVHSFCRTASVDTTVGGVEIPQDTKILCVLGAANLDEDQWPEARHYKVDRRPVGHLAFGVGIHGCVGQNIARAEAEAVLTAIASKVGLIELVSEPVWRPNNAIHALDSMRVRFTLRNS
ncbi:cytochrome P450 [Mesorhizobium sp. YC-39]|uniref:cytochrome P450 n=1 Tax=unclassified Mesorhizobium TaxID=325217 RepID=UPI0021E8701B|nr:MULTISPECIES: cytochrome P450 [unclassified Mesorhizobium]MCV3211335.1 cytochrome P450 [Mesorhizobium sp. YC-2]MCV3232977.1 cytochrome P450 [Mesorhizobium sp. YC-39]